MTRHTAPAGDHQRPNSSAHGCAALRAKTRTALRPDHRPTEPASAWGTPPLPKIQPPDRAHTTRQPGHRPTEFACAWSIPPTPRIRPPIRAHATRQPAPRPATATCICNALPPALPPTPSNRPPRPHPQHKQTATDRRTHAPPPPRHRPTDATPGRLGLDAALPAIPRRQSPGPRPGPAPRAPPVTGEVCAVPRAGHCPARPVWATPATIWRWKKTNTMIRGRPAMRPPAMSWAHWMP